MYIGPREKKRRSSPWRILIMLLLIAASLYVYAQVEEQQIDEPFVPTPTPTRSASSYIYEAEEWYLQGNLPEAIAAYEQVIALDPDDVSSYIPLARLLALEERTIEAIQRAERATELAPENARAWAVLGMAYDWNGNVKEAIEACRQAIELDPGYAEGYAYLAEAYIDAGRWAEATEAAQTALQLDERSVDAHRNYGYVLENQGNYWDAIEAYEQALEIHPNLPHLCIDIGRNYRGLGNLGAALQVFSRTVEIAPDNAKILYELGRAHQDLGNVYEAETYLEKATEADPQFGPAFGYLAINYWSRRNYEDAIPNFERAIKLECTTTRERATAFIITVEERENYTTGPSPDVVMSGEFVSTSGDNRDVLRAVLEPTDEDNPWTHAGGTVTFETQTGRYTVTLQGIPWVRYNQAYVGWFEGVDALSGDPLNTGPLDLKGDGSLEAQFEATWVEGPPIEHFYILGLAYFYMAECEKSYPLFDAALQIDPEETNALEGIRLCREHED
jgi:tetratricopeptide (TPR) repeat protein